MRAFAVSHKQPKPEGMLSCKVAHNHGERLLSGIGRE
jgi:hypothetical protein